MATAAATSLSAFIRRTNQLLRDTWAFTLSLNNLLIYGPVTWNPKGLDQVPFARAMLQLEAELKALSKALADAEDAPSSATLDRLYEKVDPAFRAITNPTHAAASSATDAISLYLEQHQVLLFTYTGRTNKSISSAYQDIFLRQLAAHTFTSHPFLEKEPIDGASEELKCYAVDFLRALQRMYRADIEGIFHSYLALLVELHNALVTQDVRVPTYEGIPPRRIAGTGYSVESRFIGGMWEMPGLEPSQREQVLALRDADGSDETALYHRLSRSQDWGAELVHVVAFLHRRNLGPLERFKVFEAGLHGELEPVEIEDAKGEHVVGQEKNVARLRRLLTAFVEGGHMPFTLLEGEGGVGKTLSLKALVSEIEGLKLVLISSDHLGQIRKYAQSMAEQPWRTVLYLDDMTFDPRHYESFKVGTQGMKQFYDNVTVVASANPSALAHVPPEVMRRWPIRIQYARPDLTDGATLRKVFRANCERVGIPCNAQLVSEFRKLHKDALQSLAPSAVYDFLREFKLAKGASAES